MSFAFVVVEEVLAFVCDTVIEQGISNERAKYTLERDGPNELSPPRTTPEWIRLSIHLFSGFSPLLWAASMLSFIVYAVFAATLEKPIPDYVRNSFRQVIFAYRDFL